MCVQVRGVFADEYHWSVKEHQNALARSLVEGVGGTRARAHTHDGSTPSVASLRARSAALESHRCVVRAAGSYLEAFNMTKVRPGGRRGVLDRERNALKGKFVEDCVHWCLPGPLDEITRLLLAYLNHLASRRPA